MSYAEDENYDGYDLEVDAENECNHDLYEQETACADGFCPICATAELAEAKRNYMDLIMSVANKYPNETRHETAKRYIQERENTPIHGPYSAIKELK
jgi:hypothetical protein